jgi:thiamine pyrophosphate-dependent acetolactate synthase large subunit-like protein
MLEQQNETAAFPSATRLDGERVADRIVAIAERLGVRHAFGIIGGACATFADALGKSSLRVVQTRHEAGAAFSAAEASLATGKPTLVFTTTGPGIINALNGLIAARWDGAHVLLVSAVTGAAHRRRLPVQETSAATMPMDVLAGTGPWFDFGVVLEDPIELAGIERALALGFGRVGAFVAHIAVPTPLQSLVFSTPWRPAPISVIRSCYSADVARSVASLLNDGPFAIWVGAGARNASRQIGALVEQTGAPFMCSPRAKGTVSEAHPLYLGVTGAGGHNHIDGELAALGIKRTLVLGSRLGEATTFYRKTLIPPDGLVHVDVDRRVFGAAYPDVRTVGIEAEIEPFLEQLLPLLLPQSLPRLPQSLWRLPQSLPPVPRAPFSNELAEPVPPGVHPCTVMAAIQQVVVDRSDALVLAESGNAFGWANHYLMFSETHRYRSSAAWGSMGHMVAGAIGAALGSGKSVVVITGDGAMLMNNEINTAVQEGLPIVWVVLNDAGYGIVRDGMQALGLKPFGCDFPATDFAGFARSQGALGRTVCEAVLLEAVLREALAAKRPFVIDVKTTRGLMSPAFMQRNASLTNIQANQRNP